MTDTTLTHSARTYRAFDTVRDGRTAVVRAIRADDKPILQEIMHHLTPEALYFRFFTYKQELTEKELAYFTEVDFIRHVGLLASLIDKEREVPVGIGRYVIPDNPEESGSAEIALVVAEEFQGLGIGSLLLKHLSKIAQAEGITKLTGFVLSGNTRILNLLNHSGLPMKQSLNEAGVLEISLSLHAVK